MSASSFNPYAPPANAIAVSAPSAPMPAGFRRFRLDPIQHRALLKRAFLRVIAIMAPLAIGGGMVMTGVLTGEFTLSSQVLPIVLIMFLFGIMFARMLTAGAPQLMTYELLVTPRVLRRTAAAVPPAEILRPEVTRMVETPAGLWVSSTAPLRALFVSRAVDGYADVRAELAQWAKIETASGWTAWRLGARGAQQHGQRDAVIGTALAQDASLREELETARLASSNAYLGHPAKVRKFRGWTVLVLWAVLIVMFLAIWQFLSPTPQDGRQPRRPAPAVQE